MLFSPRLQRPQGSIYSLLEKRPSHHSRWIKRLINGQRTAADPWPEPRFRGRILAVAPTNSLPFCYASCAQLDLLESGEYALDQSRFGLPCNGLLNSSLIPFKITKIGPSSPFNIGPENKRESNKNLIFINIKHSMWYKMMHK